MGRPTQQQDSSRTRRHGILMLFYFIMPGVMSGLGNLLVPVQLGVPELMFPKVNNVGTTTMRMTQHAQYVLAYYQRTLWV